MWVEGISSLLSLCKKAYLRLYTCGEASDCDLNSRDTIRVHQF